jgi:hypothetical protein
MFIHKRIRMGQGDTPSKNKEGTTLEDGTTLISIPSGKAVAKRPAEKGLGMFSGLDERAPNGGNALAKRDMFAGLNESQGMPAGAIPSFVSVHPQYVRNGVNQRRELWPSIQSPTPIGGINCLMDRSIPTGPPSAAEQQVLRTVAGAAGIQSFSAPVSPVDAQHAMRGSAPLDVAALFFGEQKLPAIAPEGDIPRVRREDSTAALDYVLQEYIIKENNNGFTLMWHSLPSKCNVETDLLQFLAGLGVTDVDYLYLPLNHWQKCRGPSTCRNKGYAFVHFRTEASARQFTEALGHTVLMRRNTSTTDASFQGISENICQLLRSPRKWSSDGVDGVIYVRIGDALRSVFLGSLRKMTGELEEKP